MSKKRVVYQGGHHYIVCDGKDHYVITPEWDGREYEGPCWCKKAD